MAIKGAEFDIEAILSAEGEDVDWVVVTRFKDPIYGNIEDVQESRTRIRAYLENISYDERVLVPGELDRVTVRAYVSSTYNIKTGDYLYRYPNTPNEIKYYIRTSVDWGAYKELGLEEA